MDPKILAKLVPDDPWDFVTSGIGGLGGFVIDLLLLPAGISPGTTGALSALGSLVGKKVIGGLWEPRRLKKTAQALLRELDDDKLVDRLRRGLSAWAVGGLSNQQFSALLSSISHEWVLGSIAPTRNAE